MIRQRPFHEKLSWLLDNSIPLPGGYRIGLDGLIGLIPGIGDFVGGLLSSLIVIKAYQSGVPSVIVFRMFLNVLVDSALGCLPLVGDLFDFVWKANHKNSLLLARYELAPQQTVERSWLENMTFIAAFVMLLALAIMLIAGLFGLLWSRIQG